MQIRLLTLGRLACHAGERELEGLAAQRLRCAVLLHLAIERETTRETLASLLWPERSDERARHALSQKLYELRQLLGEDWLEARSDRLAVTAAVQVDAHDFEAAVRRGALEDALSLYEGDFLAGFYLPESKAFESWVDGHRGRLGRRHREARKQVIDRCIAEGDGERALAHARRWVELEPLEDEAQHRLLELLASHGSRAEAIRQYERYERALAAEELEPLDETLALMKHVRQSTTSAEKPAAPVEISTEAPGDPLPRPDPLAKPPAPAGTRRLAVLAGMAAAVLLFGIGGWWMGRPGASPVSTERSIAVLPFLNLSPDPGSSEHLSDGIAEEVITALSSTDSLYVAARTSSFRFKGRDASIRTIGDSLRVSLVLEGSVRRQGDRLRVAVHLVNVANGYHLWSRSYDRSLEDALGVQEEIARDVVRALRIRLADPERARLAGAGTTDPDAYDLFLRGRHLLQTGTRPAVRAAIAHFDSAIARDPEYALAYANLAVAYSSAAVNRELPHDEAAAAGKAAALRSIELAPGLADAHAALGRAELELWNWSAAEREAKVAIDLDPKNSAAYATYSRVLMAYGRTEEAVAMAAKASELEPLSATAATDYAEALRADRQYELAAQLHRKSLELEPDLGRQNLAKVYIELAMYDSALAQFGGPLAAGAPRFQGIERLWTAYTRARAGRREEALSAARQFEGFEPRGPNAYLHASLNLALGDKERAFQILEQGVNDRSQRAWHQLTWDPIWDPLRQDERFRRLLRQMNLDVTRNP